MCRSNQSSDDCPYRHASSVKLHSWDSTEYAPPCRESPGVLTRLAHTIAGPTHSSQRPREHLRGLSDLYTLLGELSSLDEVASDGDELICGELRRQGFRRRRVNQAATAAPIPNAMEQPASIPLDGCVRPTLHPKIGRPESPAPQYLSSSSCVLHLSDSSGVASSMK